MKPVLFSAKKSILQKFLFVIESTVLKIVCKKTAFLSNNSKILLLFTAPLIWNWHGLRTEKANPELNNEPCHMVFANRMPLTLDLSFHGNYYKIYRSCLPYGHRDCKSQDNLVKFMDITSNEINLNLLKYFLGLRHWRFKMQIL